MACLIVRPSGSIENELPAQILGKHVQSDSGCIDRPNLVDVADGTSQLETQSFAIRIVRNDDVGPVEPAAVEAIVTDRGLRPFERPGTGQRRLVDCSWCFIQGYAAYPRKPLFQNADPRFRLRPAFGCSNKQLARDLIEHSDVLSLFLSTNPHKTHGGAICDV